MSQSLKSSKIMRYKQNPSKKRKYKQYNKYEYKQSAKQIAVKALKIAQKNSYKEYKEYTDNSSELASSDSPVIDSSMSSLIGQGDTKEDRQGNSVLVTSIHARFQIEANFTSEAWNTVRMIVWQDKQCNGSNPTSTELLDSHGILTQAFRNTDNSHRFIFHFDKIVTMNSGHSYGQVIEFNKKCNIVLKYDGTSAGIANMTSNSIGIMLISDRATAGNPPTVLTTTRIRFVDN